MFDLFMIYYMIAIAYDTHYKTRLGIVVYIASYKQHYKYLSLKKNVCPFISIFTIWQLYKKY